MKLWKYGRVLIFVSDNNIPKYIHEKLLEDLM
jgi:hypothetical protein